MRTPGQNATSRSSPTLLALWMGTELSLRAAQRAQDALAADERQPTHGD